MLSKQFSSDKNFPKMNTIITVKEWNAAHNGASMRFQNEDGSFRKSGYVVTDGIAAQFCKTKSAAIELSKTELDHECYCSMNNVDAMNN